MSDHAQSGSTNNPLERDPFHTIALTSNHPFYSQSILGVHDDIVFPIYRYTKKIYAEKFFRSGEMRLSTLRSYHDTENLGPSIADDSEGFRHFHTHTNGDIGDEFEGLPVVFYGDSVNAWTICTTKTMNRLFYSGFSADCCIRINAIEYFLEIARASTNRWNSGALVSVNYLDTVEIVKRHLLTGKSIMLTHTKPRRYEWQNEIRLILEPWSPIPSNGSLEEDFQTGLLQGNPRKYLSRTRLFPNLEPLTVYAPNARNYAEIIEYV